METLWQLEANIDDMNPQNMEYVFSLILAQGANDVWAMPMMMKKGRMASMLWNSSTPSSASLSGRRRPLASASSQ